MVLRVSLGFLAAFIMAPLGNILRGIVGASVAGLAEVIYGLVLMAAIYFMPRGAWPSIMKFYQNKTNGGSRQ